MIPSSPAPGTVVLDRFVIEREAGRGGMGAVYRAIDRPTGRVVALKLLLGGADEAHGEGIDRFVRESQTLAALGHPGIVGYVAHGRAPTPWLAMEWLEGESLAERLRRGPIAIPEAVRIARHAAIALGAAHAAGVVHRDVKPGNLFLCASETGAPTVKVVDFGIARARRADHRSLTTTGTVLGTPYYMAPEQARSLRDIGPAADVWSMGAVLYEMITGRRPFEHESVVAVLAALLLEEPLPLGDLCPEASDDLIALTHRCLSKEPRARPANGTALADALASLDLEAKRASIAPTAALTQREQRVVFLVLAMFSASGSDATVSDAGWSSSAAAAAPEGALRAMADAHAARVDALGDGALLVSIAEDGTAGDQAARAARLALAMHREVPTAALVVCGGRAELGARMLVGDVVQRATELGDHARRDQRSEVRVDPVAQTFLGHRFELTSDALGTILRGERDGESGTRAPGAPLTGRDRELRALEDLAREAHDEPAARIAWIAGPAGIGKTRLLDELTQRLSADGNGEVIALRGEPLRESSPLALMGLLLRRAAHIPEGAPIDARRNALEALCARTVPAPERARTVAFLGDLLGIPEDERADPALRVVRADPFLRGDLIERAYAAWLLGACALRPLSVLIDDAGWVDGASMALLGKVIARAHDRALFVALAGRHDGEDVPLADHQPTQLRLTKLGGKASHALLNDVAPGIERALAERIVERAEGNPLFLEEMARSARQRPDLDVLPTSVLAVVEDRITALPPEPRRVLRALSILGAASEEHALARLLGPTSAGGPEASDRDGTSGALGEALALLMRRELVVRERRSDGTATYGFRQPLVREAAYAMLTETDRQRGHRLAADVVLTSSDPDPSMIALHLDHGGDGARAAGFYAEAAERMLAAHDLSGAITRARRGHALATDPLVRARLDALEAQAHRWRGDYAEALAAAERALSVLEEGSTAWLDVLGTAISAAGRLGQLDRVRVPLGALETTPPSTSTAAPWVVTMCRAGSLLLPVDRARSRALLDAAETVAARSSEPIAEAWCGVLSASHALRDGDPGAFAHRTANAIDAFERAGDVRDAVNQRVRLGNTWTSLGAPERAVPVLTRACADAERMGLRLVEGYARQNLGHAEARLGRAGEAIAQLEGALHVALGLGDAMLEAGVRLYLAEALEEIDGARAEREASIAHERVASVPGFGEVAAAHRALALLRTGRIDEASALAEQAHRALERDPEAFEEGEASIRRAWLEVLLQTGRNDEARSVARRAWERILARAHKISDPALRTSFLEGVPDHVRFAAQR